MERMYPAGAPARISDLSWLGGEAAAKVIGWKVAGPDRKFGAMQISPGFPPTSSGFGTIGDAIGTTVTDGEVGHELLIGIEVISDSYSVRTGVAVGTVVNGKAYRDEFPATLVFCGAELSEDACVQRYETEGAKD
ncbi:hypothetical protein [Nocardioides plantarum]